MTYWSNGIRHTGIPLRKILIDLSEGALALGWAATEGARTERAGRVGG